MPIYKITQNESGNAEYLVEASSEGHAREAFYEGDSVQLGDLAVSESEILAVELYDGPVPETLVETADPVSAAFEAVRIIEAFDRDCEAAGQTDTGDAWAIFHDVKARLRAALPPSLLAMLAELETEQA